MDDPIKIMDEIEPGSPRGGQSVFVTADEWKSLRAAIEAREQWINDLQSGMYINCVYCGHRYGPESEVPASMADALKEHIEQCPEHPMSRLKEDLAQARARIARLDDSHALLLEAADKHLPGLETLKHQAERVMYETDRQSHAAVKAEALREYATRRRSEADEHRLSGDHNNWYAMNKAAGIAAIEADRIEREAIQQNCWHCGNDYNGFGEVCPDCRELCDCRWDLGIGPNLKCPIHGSKREAKES